MLEVEYIQAMGAGDQIDRQKKSQHSFEELDHLVVAGRRGRRPSRRQSIALKASRPLNFLCPSSLNAAYRPLRRPTNRALYEVVISDLGSRNHRPVREWGHASNVKALSIVPVVDARNSPCSSSRFFNASNCKWVVLYSNHGITKS